MKKSLISTLVAVPLLSLSSMAFAAEPVLLDSAAMDNVTAGYVFVYKNAYVSQTNTSPVGVLQVSALNFGFSGNNAAVITSGNTSSISQ